MWVRSPRSEASSDQGTHKNDFLRPLVALVCDDAACYAVAGCGVLSVRVWLGVDNDG